MSLRKLFLFVFAGFLVFGMGSLKNAYAEEAHAAEIAEAYAAEVAEAAEAEAAEGDSSSSASKPPSTIQDIVVRGNQIVGTNTVLSKIRSRAGGPLRQETINEDVKRLYAAGFFQDIRMEVEELSNGYRLIVNVVEKPIISEVEIDGATQIKTEKLRKDIKLIEGQILDRKKVKEGVEAIRKRYSEKGFRFVDVQSDIKIDRRSQEASIRIRITEGGKFKIHGVKVEGNEAFEEKKLLKLMRTRAKNVFLLRSGVFKEDNFQKDLERLRLFYQQEGYLDIKVQPQFDYDRKNQKIFITILVDEGQHYITGDVKVSGNRLFPESEIWQALEMLPGFTYSQFYLSKDVESVIDYYHSRGYMDARVVPDVKLNRSNSKVDVTYKIQEGDLYFVEKVVIRGNTKTRDLVIRRELRIRPGEKFDGDKVERSKQRLENTGFFEEVTYDTEPGSAPNRKDLIFRVKEKRTGELSFGGGVSSVDRFVGFAQISQRNFDLLNFPRFTGGGQSLSIAARIGSISQNYDVSFSEPYFLNKPIGFTTNLYNTRRANENVDFDEERRGLNVIFSRRFKDVFKLGTGYTVERVELDDISADAPQTVRNFAGTNWLSRWKALIFTYDSRDSVFNPTKGSVFNFNGELVGSFLGGDQDFYILQSNYTKYWQVFKKHLIEFRTRLGVAQDFGDSNEVPIFDRFYAGGLGTVRGFNFRRVGPIQAGDAVGGETLAIMNLEYTFPIFRLENFRGAVFIDAGHVNPDSYNVDFGEISVSVGPGIKVKTPLGPMAFYYGLPIANRDTEDRNGRFEFSLSRGF